MDASIIINSMGVVSMDVNFVKLDGVLAGVSYGSLF